MKRVIAGFIGLILILTCCNFSLSFGAERDIRIGLEQHYIGVGSIPISDTQISVQIGDGTKYSASSSSGFTVQAVDGTYYDAEQSFDSYSNAASYASSYGQGSVVALNNNGWRVYFTQNTTTTASSETEDSEEVTEETTTALDSNINTSGLTAITLGANAVKFSGSTSFIVNGSSAVRVSVSGDIVTLGSYKYRGVIEVYRNGSTVNAVNILPVEKYLLGVVTSEMPSSWPIEAIKAQTVAARTYACRNYGKHSKYDLCDNTDCQMYNGVNGETSSGTQAVSATSGVMAYYDGALISATYFSSSGGHTQSAEDVWGTAVPYLVGVPEINETGSKQWVRTFTFTELTELCKKASINVGNVTGVKVGESLEGGFVKSMIIEGTEGSITIEKEKIRELFKYSAEGSLYSRNFKLSATSATSNNVYVIAADNEGTLDVDVISAVSSGGVIGPVESTNMVVMGKEGEYTLSFDSENMSESQDSVTITGSGYGHGVGMSQYGAKGMAEMGYNYKDILKHYYTGIEVK